MDAKSFTILGPGPSVIKHFCPQFTHLHTKLNSLLDQAEKACHRQTLQLITKIRKLETKKFNNIGPWAQCYKTSFVRSLPIFLLNKIVCYTRLEKLDRDKHPSFVQKNRKLETKKFYKIGPRSPASNLHLKISDPGRKNVTLKPLKLDQVRAPRLFLEKHFAGRHLIDRHYCRPNDNMSCLSQTQKISVGQMPVGEMSVCKMSL